MPRQPTAQSWSRLKPHLQRLDNAALVALLRNLYALNADNRRFCPPRPELRPLQIRLDNPVRGGYTYLSYLT